MYVEIANAALFFRIVERFGLPEVKSRHDDEVFGNYAIDGRRAQLRYSPTYERWTVLADAVESDEEDDDLPISDEEVEASIIAGLEQGPRPALPANTSCRVQEEPFVFIGGRYAWTFLPELKRWAIAPLGRA